MGHFARQHELKVCKILNSFIKNLSSKTSKKTMLPPLTKWPSDPHFKCILSYKIDVRKMSEIGDLVWVKLLVST